MSAISGNTIVDRAISNIIDLIMKNDMQWGDKLPSERELAEQFSIGRPSVREAIRALNMLNVVEIRQKDGIYVASCEPKKLTVPFRLYMNMEKFNLEQLFEVRLIIEVAVAGVAARKISAEDILKVEKIVAEANVDNAYSFSESDKKLHTAIYDATNNFLLRTILLIINNLSSSSREVTGTFREVREMVHKDHILIVDALKQHDEAGCQAAMKQHLINLQKLVDINDSVYKQQFLKIIKKELDL